MKICPVNHEWIHTYFLEPYLQAVELMNFAWNDEVRTLLPVNKSFKERLISWVQGFCLALPFLNTIIWLAWQTFGKPKKFFDPYCPEVNAPSVPTRPAPPKVYKITSDTQTKSENYTFCESGVISQWKIERYPDMYIVQQYKNNFSSNSIYNSELILTEYHSQTNDQNLDIWLGMNEVRVQLNLTNVCLKMNENIPWIQHPIFGFKNFILSDKNEMHFYGVILKNPFNPWSTPFLMKFCAKKKNIEQFVEVEVVSDWGWPYNRYVGKLWFNAKTGMLHKFYNPVSNTNGELI